ncbi:MAG TPA: hypothetical protein VIU85_01060, partial [Chthoniobacterales bacterium]
AFAPLEEQISFIVTESSTRMLKLRSTFQAARTVLEDLSREIRGHIDKISVDSAVLDRLDGLLATRREQMLRQVAALVREVEQVYDETTKERAELVGKRLSWWRSFSLIWRSSAGQAELHSQIETQLRQLMQPQMDKAIRTLEADLRGLWPQMQDLLENQLSAELQKEARQSVPDFAGQRRELSDSIQTAFIDILAGKSLREQVARSFAQSAMWLRIVVAIILAAGAAAAFVKSPLVSRGSLVVAGIGVLVAIVLAFNHRRKIRRVYEQQLDPKRAEFSQTLEKQFAKAIDSFCAQMGKKIQTLKEICQTRLRRYQPWSELMSEMETKLAGLKSRVG